MGQTGRLLQRRKQRSKQRSPQSPTDLVATAKALLEWVQAEWRPKTKTARNRDLQLFAEWAGSPSVEHAVLRLCSKKGQQLAQTWLDSLCEGERYETRRRRAATLRGVSRAGPRFGLLHGAPQLSVPRATKQDVKGPTAETIHKLIAACGEDRNGLRNRALIHLMATLRLRRCEPPRMLREHYDREKRCLSVRGESIVLPNPTAAALERWLDTNHHLEGPIFHAPNRPKTPITSQGITYIFNRLSECIGERVKPGNLCRFDPTELINA
jgi:integrase